MSTTTAGLAAIELRKLADSLDKNPESVITKPWVFFPSYDKEGFVNAVRLMPRPLKKSVDKHGDERYRKLMVDYASPALDIHATVPQSLMCELIEPAKPAVFRCDPILSDFEVDEVTA